MNDTIYPFPYAFIERLDLLVNANEKRSLLESLCHEKSISIRVNTLKISRERLMEILAMRNIEIKLVPWYKDALVVTHKTTRELTELAEYKQGFFYIQSLSSMIPAVVLHPSEDEKVLDVAAAPGSKTTQLAAMMNNNGKIIANEMSRTRIYKLEENLRQQGVTNTTVRLGLGEKVWQEFPEHFDKTLVDVPCSMEGRFDCNDRKSYDHWSVKKVKMLAKQQQWLLRSAISATKPGGIIVYSTCTLSPEENEGVIDWILQKEKGNVIVEEITLPEFHRQTPIMSWNSRTFHPDVMKTLRIHPAADMEGFFVAKLRKLESNVYRNAF